jgi:hypothetical protein
MIIILSAKKIRRILDPKLQNSYSKLTISILKVVILQAVIIIIYFAWEMFYATYCMKRYDSFDDYKEELNTNKRA